jgi:predicted nucleic acid-binding protein
MKYLLDTNALGEPARARPSKPLMEKLSRLQAHVCTSVLCVGEMLYGARSLPRGIRYEQYLRDAVIGHIPVMSVDLATASRYGELRAELEQEGRSVADIDLLIAATADHHGLIIVTKKCAALCRHSPGRRGGLVGLNRQAPSNPHVSRGRRDSSAPPDLTIGHERRAWSLNRACTAHPAAAPPQTSPRTRSNRLPAAPEGSHPAAR